MSSRPGCDSQRGQRCGDLVRIMGEVVDHRDAAGRADRLQPPLQACEAGEGGCGFGERNAERVHGTQRRQSIERVVPSGNVQEHFMLSAIDLGGEADPVGQKLKIAADQVRRRAVEAVADQPVVRERVGQRRGFPDRRG